LHQTTQMLPHIEGRTSAITTPTWMICHSHKAPSRVVVHGIGTPVMGLDLWGFGRRNV